MRLTARQKLNITKSLLIALIIVSLGMSFLNVWQEKADIGDQDNAVAPVTYTKNNASVWTVVFAGAQILLILVNCYRLQVIPGVLGAGAITISPLATQLINELNSVIVYIQAPKVQLASRQWEVTPVGYAYVAVGWLLLAMTVFSAWWMRKQKAIIDAENNGTQEGAEVVQ